MGAVQAVALLVCLFTLQADGKAGGSGSSDAPLSQSAQMQHQAVMQVVIMVSPEHPPFASFSSASGLSGFDVEFLNALCQGDLECPIVTAPYHKAWPADPNGYMGDSLMRGDFDCAASSGITRSRNATLLFSKPYTKPEVGIIVEPKAAPVGAGCQGKKVGVVRTSSCDGDLARARLPLAQAIIEYEDSRSVIVALTAGSVDAALICGEAQAMAVLDSNTQQVAQERLEAVSDGLAIMCHPRMKYQVQQLDFAQNQLRAQESGIVLQRLCAKYPSVHCETSIFTTEESEAGAANYGHAPRVLSAALIIVALLSSAWRYD